MTQCEVEGCSRTVVLKTFGYECGPNGRFLCEVHMKEGGLKFKIEAKEKISK